MESKTVRLKNMINISVVMPTYQSALFIYNTLHSISEQTVKPSEILIIDDGSSDNTCQIVEKFIQNNPELNIQLIKCTHNGPGAARNIGIRRAASQWIAFLDSDDLWFPTKLETCIKIFSFGAAKFFR